MKKLLIVAAATALVASACGKDMGSPTDRGSGTVAPKTSGAGAKQPVPEKPAEAPPPPAKPGVDGEVILDGKADAGAPKGGTITVDFGEGDRATGTVVVGETSLTVRGIREGANLRLWAFTPGAEGEDSRRGTIFGTVADGVASGDLSLSGPGGEPAVRGSWKGKAR